MMHPSFFIKSVSVNLPRNKAQAHIERRIKETLYRTIYGTEELQQYIAWLKNLLQVVHKISPRSKEIQMTESDFVSSVKRISLHYEKGYEDTFATIDICYIVGEWTKGGIK